MQRMYTQRLRRSSGLEDQGSAMDWGVSLPTGKIELSSERQARLGHNRTEKTLLQLCWRLHYSNYAEPQPTVSVRPCHGMLRLRYWDSDWDIVILIYIYIYMCNSHNSQRSLPSKLQLQTWYLALLLTEAGVVAVLGGQVVTEGTVRGQTVVVLIPAPIASQGHWTSR